MNDANRFESEVMAEQEMTISQHEDRRINKLAAALCKAQAMITGAIKDSANPFFKSTYADLASVCEAIRKPFSDNGLSYVQLPSFSDGKLTLTTILMHESGQSVTSSLTMPTPKPDPQGIGSVITYARRYALSSMAGVPQVDDDSEAAMGRKSDPTPISKMKQPKIEPVSVEQVNILIDLIQSTNADAGNFMEFFKVTDLSQLTDDQFLQAQKMLSKKKKGESHAA